jgi:hypothetical protein
MKTKSDVAIASVLTISMICLVFSAPLVFAVPPDPDFGTKGLCLTDEDDKYMTCCWDEPDLLHPGETIKWCQTCDNTSPPSNCEPIFMDTPPPKDPSSSPGDGIL